VSDLPDPTPPPLKLGDIAEAAGLRRIHLVAWRDLDDIEAGGSEVHAAEVARRWAEAGIDVLLRTSYAAGHPAKTRRDGYDVVRKAGRYLVFPRTAAAETAHRHGRRDGLVEIWNGMPFLSPLWCRGPRVVLMHHVHAEMWRMVLPPRLAFLGDTLESRIAPKIYRRSRMITLSPTSKAEMLEIGFRDDRVEVVPPGIAAHFTPGGARTVHPSIVACGRLQPVKRFDRLIRAVVKAHEQVPDLTLTIVGTGALREELGALVDQYDAADYITFAGRVTDEELVELYRSAWAVASSSVREGWGMTLTEAAACGTPAVATRIPGHIDAVAEGRSGLLADDVDGLAAHLVTVANDRALREQLSAGALAHAATLSWNQTATRILLALAEEAGAHRLRPGPPQAK
jgi:glycosyltransferase involved in cell wall biosynthesis